MNIAVVFKPHEAMALIVCSEAREKRLSVFVVLRATLLVMPQYRTRLRLAII